jgi:hypothetical protein
MTASNFLQQRLGHRSIRHESYHGLHLEAYRHGLHAHPEDPLLSQEVSCSREESRIQVEATLG